jgi:predicted ABC-type ATPase
MAGSPGAGKTEASIALINLFADTAILRIDPDERRSEFADYEGGNAWIFQSGVSILVEKILDCAFDQRQSFVLDGTLSNIDVARRNVDRSLRKGRFVQILYVYQNPLLAWDFVKAREEAEGRRIRPEHFVDQYFAARGFTKGAKSPFADFIRNAKSEQKKRVYSEVLTEATKQQNLVMMEAEAKRG